MQMPPRVRKLSLTAHVVSSVGWVGAVLVFLALAAIGLTSPDAQIVRGVYLVMDPAARMVLMPLAIATLVTGLIQSLGTPWGVLRHWWVVFKLGITVFATLVLYSYLGTFRHLAEMAADPSVELPLVRSASPALHAGIALVLLLVATLLAIFKPRGLTKRGRRLRSRA